MPGSSYVVTITGGISVPRVEKTVTIVAGQWKDPNFVLINTGLLGLPGGPAGRPTRAGVPAGVARW